MKETSFEGPIRRIKTTVDSPLFHTLLWTRKLYIYLFCELLVSLMIGILLQNVFLLYALDAILFFPIFAAHIYHWKIARLFQVASFWGIVKSIIFITAILITGDRLDSIVSQGAVYHNDTLIWILTGEGIIAHPEQFIPLHISGVFRVVTSAMGSCGLITLIGGSRELNVMNFHVAQLLQSSHTPIRTLLFGWPIWSLLRGWSYLSLMVASAGMFFVIIRRHPFKWQTLGFYMLIGLMGCTIDVALKVWLAPQWRELLYQSLL